MVAQAEPSPPRDTRSAQLLSKSRLPRPSTRTRIRKEIVLRPATPADAAPCVLLDSAYATTHVWQLDTRQDFDELRVSFRQVRLPRELTLIAPHHPPALSGGMLRRGMLWLVAEEIEVGGTPRLAPPSPERRATHARLPVWSHSVRRSSSGSSVQLGLPRAPEAEPDDEASPMEDERRGKVVGYVIVAGAPRDRQAYLRTLVVDRHHRRAGIGARLLGEAKRWAARNGAECLIADAPARNYPAIRLLQKSGFAFCGFNDSCYAENEVAVFFGARL
ncbi:MAG: GNAT family N-acetyltransferase [Chloroflexota bacterium]